MSVGGVNPLEWILPPVALSHALVDTAAKAITGKEAIVTPGSSADKARKASAAQDARLKEAQSLADSRQQQDESGIASAQADFESRQRAAGASEVLTGKRRGSQDLAYTGAL